MKIICIDDEQLALDYSKVHLETLDNVEIVGMYTNISKAMKAISREQVDVVMLDIQMPEISGLELAEKIIEEKPDVFIVFVTAYSNYAVEAFQLNAIDYLIKPITYDRIKVTMERIEKQVHLLKEVKEQVDVVKIKTGNHLLFEVEKDNFKAIPWRTTKTQELFVYLLQHRGKLVEKSAILEVLWEGFNVEKGYALLYTTVYNVRKALRLFSDHIVLHNMGNGYFLELKNVTIDVVEWEDTLRKLGTVNSVTVEQFIEVMMLNEEEYLAKLDYLWLEAERERIKQLWMYTARSIATYFEGNEKYNEALDWYQKVCDRNPEDEETHFAILKLYEKIGDFKLIQQQYEKMVQFLDESLDVEPSDYITKWYSKVIN